MKLFRIAILLLPLLWYGHRQPDGMAGAMLAQSTANTGENSFGFRIVLDLKFQMADAADVHETHHIETVYGPQMWGSCPPRRPGERCSLRLSEIHGTATGWNAGAVQSSRIQTS